jgi:hypothetical protein
VGTGAILSGILRSPFAGGLVAFALAPRSAWAGHSYTELYNPFYVVGVGLVVIVSFVVVAVFLGRATRAGAARYERLGRVPAMPAAPARVTRRIVRGLAVASFALLVVAGLGGSPIETWNPAPTGIWLAAWVVIPAVQVLAGNVWSVINPWKAVFGWLPPAAPRWRYPREAGVWPAVALFLLVLWLRGVWPDALDPRMLAVLVVVYSAVTWTGMALFGAHVWLARGECFTVFYTLLAGMGLVETRVMDAAVCARCGLGCRNPAGECIDCEECSARSPRRQLNLRPWAVGLLARPPAGLDMTAFVLLMLGGGLFGGILDTRWWERVRVGLGSTAERSWAPDSLALAAFMALTLAVYGLASGLASASAAAGWSTADVARGFAFSMVPLAVGFHLTHGLDHSLENVQLLGRLVSDPFGFGWNLFGTRTRPFDKPDPWVVWCGQLGVIVGAHVAGIWLAHAEALTLFGSRAAAFRGQAPMVAVMVLFTVSGLWILSRIPMVM